MLHPLNCVFQLNMSHFQPILPYVQYEVVGRLLKVTPCNISLDKCIPCPGIFCAVNLIRYGYHYAQPCLNYIDIVYTSWVVCLFFAWANPNQGICMECYPIVCLNKKLSVLEMV